MGYYASYSGEITVRKTPESLMILDDDIVRDTYGETDEKVEVCFVGSEKYYEEEWLDFLQKLEPFTVAGNIRFDGDEDCHWVFSFRNGKWYEDRGEIVYEESECALFEVNTL